ncbi:MAG: extracellular solute-binding protein [Oscillospiraceae bacterium]|nr:extracellular solute-binding protein [Oscillospiraceae bacterium]
MKKNILKRCTAAAVSLAAMLSLASCGKQEVPMASKENVYRTTEIPFTETFEYINTMTYGGDRIYIFGNVNTTPEPTGNTDGGMVEETYSYSSDTVMAILDSDGNSLDRVVISSNSDNSETGSTYSNIQKVCVADDGTVALLMQNYTYNMQTNESTESYFIKKLDKDGKELSTTDISSVKEQSNAEYFYVGNMEMDNSGNIYLVTDNEIYVCDSTGKFSFKLGGAESTDTSGSYMNGIYKTGDGRIVAMMNSYEIIDDEYKNKNTAKVIDFASKSFTEEYRINANYYSFFNGSSEYDLYVSTDNALLGLDLETGETTIVLDWLKCGLDTTTMNNATILSDGRVLCTTYKYEEEGGGYSWSGSDMILNILTKVDPSEIPDKQLISVYTHYLNYKTKQQIVEFNQTSDKYQIEVRSYSDYDDGTGDYTAGYTKLTNDLISGDIPDILIIDQYSMPVDSYISKGILADLNQFIDSDETINRADYLTNIFDAYSIDGKLYQLVPDFTINTLVGKTSLLDGKQSWTMAEYLEFVKGKPEGIFQEWTKENFLANFLSYGMGSYVNKETGECYFNTADFKALLEAANEYPEEINYDELYKDESYWNDLQASYRNGTQLLSAEYIYRFNSMIEIEKGKFGEEVTFIGYPVSSGNGSVINANSSYAITAKAKNPDGAWEFLKYFLSDDYQNNASNFPVKLSAYDALKEQAKEKPFYTDENGNKVEYENTYWIGETSVDIGVNTDADNEKLMNLITSASTTYQYDTDLMKIITEEAAAYFSGQKSLDETADIIQNRASIYISENR